MTNDTEAKYKQKARRKNSGLALLWLWLQRCNGLSDGKTVCYVGFLGNFDLILSLTPSDDFCMKQQCLVDFHNTTQPSPFATSRVLLHIHIVPWKRP